MTLYNRTRAWTALLTTIYHHAGHLRVFEDSKALAVTPDLQKWSKIIHDIEVVCDIQFTPTFKEDFNLNRRMNRLIDIIEFELDRQSAESN